MDSDEKEFPSDYRYQAINNLLMYCNGESLKREDRAFYLVSAHGGEIAKNYYIPPNVRVIMFCYSERLQIRDDFDRFIWDIILDKDKVKNYCSFLSSFAKYPTIYDHFCIFKEGMIIDDILFTSDDVFRDGIFRLPIKASVRDTETGKVYVTDEDIIENVIRFKPYPVFEEWRYAPNEHIIFDKEKSIEVIRKKKNPIHIPSPHIKITNRSPTKLSVIADRISRDGGGTVILFTCRARLYDGPRPSRGKFIRVRDEIENLISSYKKGSYK